MVLHISRPKFLVSWWCKKHTLVSKSSTKTEYRSLTTTTLEVLWLQSLLMELIVDIVTPTMYCDNLNTKALSHNPVRHAKTKHMELDIFFLREKVLNKAFVVKHILASLQNEDLLTKALSSLRFLALSDQLKVVDKTTLH